jgi:hypothetical protein
VLPFFLLCERIKPGASRIPNSLVLCVENYETLTDAINGLKAKGYLKDFNLNPDYIERKARNMTLYPSDFTIDKFYRFEGASNPDDSSIVYAISSKEGLKGTLVNAYGVYADSLANEMVKKLQIAR